jgi:hypothetical protein
MMIKIIILLTIILFPFSFGLAADNGNQTVTNRQGYMLMLAEEKDMLDKPDGRKLGAIEEDHMIWVSEIRGDFLHIQVEGWIRKTFESFRQTPFTYELDKGAKILAKAGDADVVATISEGATINVLGKKDGFAQINVNAWISKPISNDKNEDDPYADIKDKTNKVVETQVGIRQKK